MKLIIACATDDGQTYIDRHFGDARYYAIYQLEGHTWSFLRKIPNTSKKEEKHADPEKAKSVTAILKDEHVQVVMAKEFGPNIARIKRHFVHPAGWLSKWRPLKQDSQRYANILSQLPLNLRKERPETFSCSSRNPLFCFPVNAEYARSSSIMGFRGNTDEKYLPGFD